MKLTTVRWENREVCGIVTNSAVALLPVINSVCGLHYPEGLLPLIESGALDELKNWYEQKCLEGHHWHQDALVPLPDVQFAPLYRRPRKIWGIGLNYVAHARDLDEQAPSCEPASFMKPDTAIIGHGDDIHLPLMSEKTTGEAELGLIFGKRCRNIDRTAWKSALAGFTSIVDMTAEDILRRNPRNLTQSKSFDTFFSFGPFLYTVDELKNGFDAKVQTVINGRVHAENVVSNMMFPPDYLVSYHSRVMTMLPGDIISTGTPGAVELSHGDTIECRIDGFQPLVNKVVDLKVTKRQ
ncbi:MAG: fumarylacetoacetate hydrolase family protein [Polyangiaceae bacterium]|jgi:2-keto-4-pentenoate hydratase/2-oxohepta-3-ene-1,7-dioic acid hydratase in catechol pathway|nr:fumarylacetoacetate hydrolase family protein [Polyangiaceae bacterium]